MELDRHALRRTQEFVRCVDAVMNRCPLPVPPPARDGWRGQVLPTREFYLAYSRLPSALQGIAARGYGLCMRALQAQGDVAKAAQFARYQLYSELLEQIGLTPEQLYPDASERWHRSPMTDDDATALDESLRRAALDALAAAQDGESPPTTAIRSWVAWLGAGVSVAALAMLGVLLLAPDRASNSAADVPAAADGEGQVCPMPEPAEIVGISAPVRPFITDVDTVIVARPERPDIEITVRELPSGSTRPTGTRTRTIEADSLQGRSIEIPIKDDHTLTFDIDRGMR